MAGLVHLRSMGKPTIMTTATESGGNRLGSEWNVDTLKEHIERILNEHAVAHRAEHVASETSLKSAFQAAEKAIEKTETNNEHRFHAVNEFRELVNDVIRRLELAQAGSLTIREFKEYTDRQEERGRETRTRLAAERTAEARSRMALLVAILLALLSAIVSIAISLAR
ncbi:MAG: hypothetical protein ACR2M4_02930 [Actinomycetota bacterium]